MMVHVTQNNLDSKINKIPYPEQNSTVAFDFSVDFQKRCYRYCSV